jgi:hypothetical protein
LLGIKKMVVVCKHNFKKNDILSKIFRNHNMKL